MKMPFGKFKGEDICDLETSYLKWIEENIDRLDPNLRAEINHEIERREGNRRPGKGFEKSKNVNILNKKGE